ncbi:hypothetical protein D3C72_275710 [compost metagenome]
MKIVATPALFDWAPFRQRRNALLTASDRYMLPDFPVGEADRALLATYRQQLRDMFAGCVSPSHLIFPAWPLES